MSGQEGGGQEARRNSIYSLAQSRIFLKKLFPTVFTNLVGNVLLLMYFGNNKKSFNLKVLSCENSGGA